jgi:microsomal dipeptidase-like Zn-dependent dipeptidase
MRTALSTLSPVALALACLAAPISAQDAAETALIEKARGIHQRVITLDTHKDISATLATEPGEEDTEEQKQRYRASADPTVDGNNQVDFPKMLRGGYDCAFFIVYVGQVTGLNAATYAQMHRSAMLKFEAIHRMAEKYPDQIEIAYTPADVRRIAAAGKLIACIGIENGGVMGEDLSNIELYYERGARYMSITHNGNNQLGDSQSAGGNPANGGLTELGKKAVAEMNRLHPYEVGATHDFFIDVAGCLYFGADGDLVTAA